jgi:serine/threonine-protein kinase 24/25/MST4
VRHVGRPGTVGRTIQVSGPPLTWENNGSTRSDGSSDSSSRGSSSSVYSHTSIASSVTAKGELPPIPPGSPNKFRDEQATVRHAHSNGSDEDQATQRGVRREPSDEIYDYEDRYIPDPYAPQPVVTKPATQNHVPAHLDEDLPDTTMLDSVILPAIASVCAFR